MGLFLVPDNRVSNGPLDRSLRSFARTAHSLCFGTLHSQAGLLPHGTVEIHEWHISRIPGQKNPNFVHYLSHFLFTFSAHLSDYRSTWHFWIDLCNHCRHSGLNKIILLWNLSSPCLNKTLEKRKRPRLDARPILAAYGWAGAEKHVFALFQLDDP